MSNGGMHRNWIKLVIQTCSVFTLVNSAHAAMQALDDHMLSEETGQSAFYTNYIPSVVGDPSGSSFFTLGIQGNMEINANIQHLQLGCGGVNSASKPGLCDIDINNLSLSGVVPDNATNRPATDAVLTNPFLRLAIKNPTSISTRSISGVQFGAESIIGMLTTGTVNDTTLNGINSLSGYLEIGSASGIATTNARHMTQAIGDLTGRVSMCIGVVVFGACVGGYAPIAYTASTYDLYLQSANASFTTDPAVVNGKRQTDVKLTGQATLGDILFSCQNPAATDCITATALGLPLKEGVNGAIKNLKANVNVSESLGLIHKLALNGNAASLSLQNQNILWPGAKAANVAQQGWWLSVENPINIGNISPSNNVDIPDSTLKQALGPAGAQTGNNINAALYQNPPTCSLTGCLFGTVLQVPDIYLGPGGAAPAGTPQTYVDFPLNNQQLQGQYFAPNCYGTLKFC